jgi:hypothetical protein
MVVVRPVRAFIPISRPDSVGVTVWEPVSLLGFVMQLKENGKARTPVIIEDQIVFLLPARRMLMSGQAGFDYKLNWVV